MGNSPENFLLYFFRRAHGIKFSGKAVQERDNIAEFFAIEEALTVVPIDILIQRERDQL